MKKYILGPGLLIVVLIIVLVWNKQTKDESSSLMRHYKEEWGVDLPVPDQQRDIWGTAGSFNGDGERFTVFDYSSPEISVDNRGMIEVTAHNINELKSKIDRFKDTTISVYTGDSQERVRKVFAEYPIQVEEGDTFFYREKNEGNDYFIALFKVIKNKLYTMEWHQ